MYWGMNRWEVVVLMSLMLLLLIGRYSGHHLSVLRVFFTSNLLVILHLIIIIITVTGKRSRYRYRYRYSISVGHVPIPVYILVLVLGVVSGNVMIRLACIV
jgi:hypothetical protein